MAKLKINPLVVKDLNVIRNFIAEDNAEAAQKLMEDIYKCFGSLQRFPAMGNALSKRVSFKTNYKYFAHGNYIIIYLHHRDCVEIYRVIDRYQDFTAILFG